MPYTNTILPGLNSTTQHNREDLQKHTDQATSGYYERILQNHKINVNSLDQLESELEFC